MNSIRYQKIKTKTINQLLKSCPLFLDYGIIAAKSLLEWHALVQPLHGRQQKMKLAKRSRGE